MGLRPWKNKALRNFMRWSRICLICKEFHQIRTWIILCMRPAIERLRYIVMLSLIGWAHTKMIPAGTLKIFLELSKFTQLRVWTPENDCESPEIKLVYTIKWTQWSFVSDTNTSISFMSISCPYQFPAVHFGPHDESPVYVMNMEN